MKKTKIIMFEDDKFISDNVKKILESNGYIVTGVFANALDGISFIFKDRPDLILMDITLKGDIDGIEAAKRIKKYSSIPIIFLTANRDLKVFEKIKALGADGYLLKDNNLNYNLIFQIEFAISRYEQEIKLKESEARFRIIADYSYDWETYRDNSGKLIYSSPAFEIITGYKNEDYISGKVTFKDFIHPDDLETTLTGFNEAVNGKKTDNFECRFISKDGIIKYINISSQPVFIENDKFIGFRSSIIDITERKQAEESLKYSENKFSNLVKKMPVGVLIQGPNAEILMSNSQALELLGLTEEQLLGKTSFDPDWNVIHEDGSQFPGPIHPVPQAIATHKPVRNVVMGVYRPTKADLVWLLVEAEPELNEDGSILQVVCTFIDITLRKKAEEALRESEELFKIIATQTPDHIIVQDKEFKYTLVVNPQLGLTENEMLGKTDFDLIAKEEAVKITNVKKKVFETGESLFVKIPIISNKGEIEYFEGSYIPKKDQNDIIDGIIGYFRNVTESVNSEIKLKESEEYNRRIIETANEGIWVIDNNEKTTFVNRKLADMLGYTVDEFLTKRNIDFMLDEDLADHKQQMIERSHAVPGNYVRKFLNKDCSIIYGLVVSTPLFDKNDNYTGSFAMITDITKRKLAEEKLKEEKQRLDFHVNNSPMATVEWDSEFFVTRWAGEAEKIFGWNDSEIIGKRIMDLKIIYEEDIPIVERTIKQLTEGSLYQVTSSNRNYTKDGKVIYCVWYNSVLLDSKGKMVSVMSRVLDITDRKLAMEQLKKSEEKFRMIFDNNPDAIFMLDFNYNFIHVNTIACERMGYSYDEFIKMNARDINSQVNSKSIEERVKILFDSGHSIIETEHITKNGLIIPVEISSRIIDYEGKSAIISIARDVTDRKQNDEKIKKLSIGVENSPASIVITDKGGKIEYVNPKFCEITGYSFEEAIGKTPRILKSGQTEPEFYKNLWKTISNGNQWHGEIYNKKKNGDFYWENVSISPIKNNDGKITNYIAIKEDVTIRKQIEETQLFLLRNDYTSTGENFFESLAKYLANTLDMDYVCIDKLLGDKLTAQTLAIYYDGNFEIKVEYTLKETPCGDVVGNNVCCFPSGVRHLFPNDSALQDMNAESYVGVTLWSSTGHPIGLIAVISRKPLKDQYLAERILKLVAIKAGGELERTQAEEIIQKQSKFLNTVINSLSHPFYVIDADNYNIMLANKAVSKNIDGNIACYQLIHNRETPCDDLQHPCPIKYVKETGLPTMVEHHHYDKRGNSKILEIHAHPIFNENYEVIQVIEYSHDITQRKHAEEEMKLLLEQLRESNDVIESTLYQKNVLLDELTESETKLKETVAVKDKFFSIVAHDIRGPFSGFLGLTDLMAKEADELTKEEIKRMSDAINKSANSVFNLIEDLLLWSRTQTGSISFTPELLDLYELSINTIYALKQNALIKNIELINKIKPVTHITGDRNMLRTVLRNLVSNAIKFTNAGGRIEIGVTVQPSEGLKPSEGYYEIYVKDNGIGIPKSDLDKLFRVEEHYTTTGTNKEKGTGLGLIICKEFIEKHGGNIRVESEEGKGSTFFFTLPNHNQTFSDKKETVNIVTSKKISNAKILIADDDHASYEFLFNVLKKSYTSLLRAKNGTEAVEMVENNPDINLVLMDIQMPEMDGFVATKQIKKLRPDLPIIAQTAYDFSGNRNYINSIGFDDFLTKPIEINYLKKLIEKYIR